MTTADEAGREPWTEPLTEPSTGPLTEPWTWDVVDRQVRDRVASTLSLAEDKLGRGPLAALDPVSFAPALARTSLALAREPSRLVEAATRFAGGVARASAAAAARAAGRDAEGPVKTGRDKRFTDPAWSDNAGYWWLRQYYLLAEEAIVGLVSGAGVPEDVRAKTAFVTRTALDALAPTNFVPSNPAVVKRAFETGGLSLARGARNFVTDLATNQGQPRQVATGVHEVGRDLAITPGKVVFRNDLMELIQYAPATPTVHQIPLLFSPPWINKYYVMDLAPGRSLVEWAVQNGHTVFLISYRNPDASMRNIALDDYLLSGPVTALDVIRDITRAEKANLLGLCLGGTLTMALLAYLDARGEDRINNATFLNTLIDFSDPGLLGIFADERSISRLERTMRRTGFLPAENMRRTFDLLRGNDLIWNYVVKNWLLGEDPPAFDLLTWNADSTRMPADMHSFYLRSCYLENQLAEGTMELAGQRLDVRAVDQDLYVLAAEQDHIAPWRSSYKGALLPKGNVRFVLSNSGHIAGIVNPPNPKSVHRVVEDGTLPTDPDEWFSRATLHPTTWWLDWAAWIGERAGGQRKPPRTGSRKHRPLADAPGTYVFGT